ncbi:hypothetical protein B4900_16560 [Yersinia rohdei]|nr:hypothetical protein B4900_16560 [Yersinia rohdei]
MQFKSVSTDLSFAGYLQAIPITLDTLVFIEIMWRGLYWHDLAIKQPLSQINTTGSNCKTINVMRVTLKRQKTDQAND